ncbi:hypothetical protein PENSUB_5143 [Penicillium subrubescens]|uniref:C3H1-type domain-containing protein n=1 Tax=Penicillium subrubescens TaxID=1316194 RepID=A0A1Q5UAI4_9EURO|nr:hypothetical protein PENSUB_5143 [Penicillium subrubescens]
MLRDSDIDSLTNHLGALSKENQKHHETLQDVLKQFKNLLEDYNSLKSDYEEVKEGREKYKKQARGQFQDHFIKAGAEGGIKAARELSDSVRELMHSTLGMQADQCRIMVRVYANMLGLSKTLARAGLCGHEARSLASFTSAFNRAQDLFDFVDAAEKKEGSDFKIRGGFLTICKPAGISLHSQQVLTRCFELQKCSDFSPIPTSADISTLRAATILGLGTCKYGNSCIKQHVMPGQTLSVTPADESPKQLWSTPTTVGRSKEFLFTHLPPMSLKAEGRIAVNKDGERLDTYCPHPSMDAMDEYHHRAKEHKVCNSYHLSGECGDKSCLYDHSDVSDTIFEALRYILRQHPCPRAGACRSIKCYKGHLCQKPNCRPVGGWPCRFDYRAHILDLKVSQLVPPVAQAEEEQSQVSGDSHEGTSSPGTLIF